MSAKRQANFDEQKRGCSKLTYAEKLNNPTCKVLSEAPPFRPMSSTGRGTTTLSSGPSGRSDPFINTIDNTLQNIDDNVHSMNAILRKGAKAYDFVMSDSMAPGKFLFQPNISDLPSESQIYADFTNESKKVQNAMLEEGVSLETAITEANQRLQRRNVPYEILPEHSSNQHLAFRNMSTGEVDVAFRGTEVRLKEDALWKDVVATGRERNSGIFREAENAIRNLQSEGYTVRTLTGSSMGGTKVLWLGDKYGIKAVAFNPLVGVNELYGAKSNPNVLHDVYLTTTDIASVGLNLRDMPNTRVFTRDPERNQYVRYGDSELGEFTSGGNLKEGLKQQHVISQFSNQWQDQFSKIDNSFKETLMRADIQTLTNEGKTYTDFVRRWAENDVDASGRLGGHNRAGKNSNLYEIWQQEWNANVQDSGAGVIPREAFTAEERAYFQRYQASERNAYRGSTLSNEELTMIREGQSDALMQTFRSQMETLMASDATSAQSGNQKYSPEFLSRFRKLSTVATEGAKFGTTMLTQLYLENGLHMEHEEAVATTGALSVLPGKALNAYGTAVAAEGGILSSVRAGIGAVAASTAAEVPAAAAAFLAADRAYVGVHDGLTGMGVNEQNATTLASAAAGGTAQASAELIGGGARVSRMAVSSLMARAAGYQAVERATSATAARFATKAATSTMKASVAGAIIGEAIDIGVESYSLFDAWAHQQRVSSNRIGETARNIVDPFAFTRTHTVLDYVGFNSVGHIAGDVANFAFSGIAGLFGAESDEEIQRERAQEHERIAKKYFDAVTDLSNVPHFNEVLTQEEIDHMNEFDPQFFHSAHRVINTAYERQHYQSLERRYLQGDAVLNQYEVSRIQELDPGFISQNHVVAPPSDPNLPQAIRTTAEHVGHDVQQSAANAANTVSETINSLVQSLHNLGEYAQQQQGQNEE